MKKKIILITFCFIVATISFITVQAAGVFDNHQHNDCNCQNKLKELTSLK
ncbi:MAG: hypothetical protein OSJ65_04745 [Bacilli bacterium]|nr:hypothetical protein [Bacilli bacterium]